MDILTILLFVAVSLGVHFACYYFPTKYVVRSAGLGDLPLGYILRGWAGMMALLAGAAVLTRIVLPALFP